MNTNQPVPRAGWIGAARLLIAGLLVVGVLEAANWLTAEQIERARHTTRLEALAVVLPASSHDNVPVDDTITIESDTLGPGRHTVYRARQHDQPAGLVLEVTATQGYAGHIELLVSIDTSQHIVAVRVTEHRETPGLGDRIDSKVDDWIESFTHRSLGNPPAQGWAVRKDGGAFDGFAGATVTPRAVVEAVQRCLEFVHAHESDLYAAPSGANLIL